MLQTLQNFYKATVSTAWTAGTGNKYVSILPTSSAGRLVINPSDISKREIVSYTATGTDSGGNYITISARGVGGTTDQAHDINEPVRMNLTAQHYADIQTELDLKLDDSQLDIDGTLAANSDTKIATQKATKTYAMPFSYLDTNVSLGTSDVKVPSQKAVKNYVDGVAIAGAPNASTTVKGNVEISTLAEAKAETDIGGTGATLSVTPSQLPIVNEVDLVAGEDLTAGDAVMVAAGTEGVLLNAFSTTASASESGAQTSTNWYYQSFTTSSTTNKILSVNLVGSLAASYVTCRLRSTPNGTDIASGSIGQLGFGGAAEEFSITFSGNSVSPNTTYYLVFNITSTLNPGYNQYFVGGTTSTYSGGVSGISSNSGSSWTTPSTTVTGDFYFKVYEGYTVAGRAYKTSANSTTYVGAGWTTNFIGFVKTTVAAAAIATVRVSSMYKALSGLIPGSTYYLSNTPGQISTTPGAVSKKVGLALSSTGLLIKNDN